LDVELDSFGNDFANGKDIRPPDVTFIRPRMHRDALRARFDRRAGKLHRIGQSAPTRIPKRRNLVYINAQTDHSRFAGIAADSTPSLPSAPSPSTAASSHQPRPFPANPSAHAAPPSIQKESPALRASPPPRARIPSKG